MKKTTKETNNLFNQEDFLRYPSNILDESDFCTYYSNGKQTQKVYNSLNYWDDREASAMINQYESWM